MTELKPVTLNCEIFWASMQEPNRMSNKYQIDLGNLSKAAADALEMRGINVRRKDGQGDFITVKSKNPIRAYDKDGEEIKGVLVGNGSIGKAVIGYYDWKNPAGQQGCSPSLMKLVITDLIIYGGGPEVKEADLEEAL